MQWLTLSFGGPFAVDLFGWTFCGGPFRVDLFWWTFSGGPFVVDLLWWTFCVEICRVVVLERSDGERLPPGLAGRV